jgi:flagellar basal-body rod protein FlgB
MPRAWRIFRLFQADKGFYGCSAHETNVACELLVIPDGSIDLSVALEDSMKADMLSDPTMDAMANYLTRLSKRQQIVASNLANIDTPGYKTKDVSFRATMDELLSQRSITLETSRPGHIAGGLLPNDPEATEVQGLSSRPDGNNVDLDKELLKLGQTSGGYAQITQFLKSKLRIIASAIQEGKQG